MNFYKEAKEILKLNYSWCFMPAEGTGEVGFTAYILEFPGCISEGNTLGEAHRNLKRAAESWVEAVLYQGMKVPKPKEHIWPRHRPAKRNTNGPNRKRKTGRTTNYRSKYRT